MLGYTKYLLSRHTQSCCITLETVGDIGGGFGGAALAGLFQGVGLSTAGVQTNSLRNSSENRRYAECSMLCKKIEQAVEEGKRGGAAAVAPAAPVYPSAPSEETPRPKFCPNCGARNEGSKFCPSCGSRLG